MTITYDPKKTSTKKLAEVIAGLGYEVEEVEPPKPDDPEKGVPVKAPLPEQAPKSFVDAFKDARKNKRPIVIDFWAEWCGPCVHLKKKTLADPEVVKALEGIELIYVDLDESPELAAVYGVKSIPDVFFIDADGYIVDRLRKFEAAGPFLARLEKLLAKATQEAEGRGAGK